MEQMISVKQEKSNIPLITLLITAIALLIILIKVTNTQNNVFKVQINNLNKIVNKNKLDSITLRCMQKTMLVAYPRLSKYEAKYYSIIYIDLANKYNVDWRWFPAMMWTESRFSPTAKSEDNAYNLTQVIESTLKIQCEKLGIDYKSNTKWHDLHMMIAGIDYLCQGFEKGDEYAIKRYIGGPGYKKASKESDQEDIKEYWDSVSTEASKINYIFRGIFAEEYNMSNVQNLNAMLSRVQ